MATAAQLNYPFPQIAKRNPFLGSSKIKKASIFHLGLRRKSGSSNGYKPLRVVSEKVVGIDLGTTNSAVAAMEGGQPTIVTNAEGQRTTPSVVAYTKGGDRLVGQIAKRQAVVNPENTFFSVKRFIGRKMNEVDDESKQVSYRVVRDDIGNVKVECPATGNLFAPEEISAQVLRKLVDDASKFLNDKVDRMVKDAERYAKEDKERREAIDTKNQAESVVYQTEKQLKELGDKVGADVKEKVELKL